MDAWIRSQLAANQVIDPTPQKPEPRSTGPGGGATGDSPTTALAAGLSLADQIDAMFRARARGK